MTPVRAHYAERFTPVFDDFDGLLSHMDGDDHTRIRNLVHAAFTRTEVDTYTQWIEALADRLMTACVNSGEADLVQDFAVPLPITVISEIVGIPPEMRPQVKAWSDDYAAVAVDFYTSVSTEVMERGMNSISEFRAYLLQRIEELRNDDSSALLRTLAEAEADGEVLSNNEVLANTILMLAAGNETTTATLGHGMRLFFEHPDQVALIRDNPTMMTNAVEEIMRLHGPIQFIGRFALEDVEVGGKTIPKGDLLLPVIASANRDPEAFPDPTTFDITRDHIHHLAFATGRHMCAGLQLAKLEARLGLEAFLKHMDSFELTETEFPLFKVFNIHGFSKLRVKTKATN
ncbi:cytochrome P450 [Ruegeria sp. 2205SS24-7]|uniref:cytochrome P450 n=1 Tax=Ruegeria discodermiae TaxID=3064389 RepID=UPI0027419589|nr:cytochrome P450 [Ruegeria sp. 2205SS24-7]MDP5217324.1 cytochrome P450 [Ruegeria sp. 2205SS24-7]